MADLLQVATKRNPHLKVYIAELRKSTNTEPKFIEALSRDMGKQEEVNFLYPVGDPIFIHVYGSKHTEKSYNAIEPLLEKESKEQYDSVLDRILVDSAKKGVHSTKEEYEAVIDEILEEAIKIVESDEEKPKKARKRLIGKESYYLTQVEFDSIEYYIKRNIIENGRIEPFLRDPYIEDIHCIGIRDLSIIHKVFGSLNTNIQYENVEELEAFVKMMSERIGRPATMTRPIIDGALPDGSRINIIYASDVSIGGPSFTIRKFSTEPLSIVQLIRWKTISSLAAAYLWVCLENGMSVFVCGETASGKTTLLNAIFPFIRYDQKVYTAEDTLEVQPPHKVWQQLSTREFGPEESRVDAFALLKAALRSRPDYIVVGEIRGKEGNVAFQAMQIGNAVMATFHASSIKRMIQRFASPPINVPVTSMDSLNVAVFLSAVYRKGSFLRRSISVDEILGYNKIMGGVMTRSVFVWNPSTDEQIFRGMNNSYVLEEKIAPTLGYKDRRKIYVDMNLRRKILEQMSEHDIVSYRDVNEVLVAFQKEGVEGLPFPL